MTVLCIDELSSQLKRRWGWSASASHIPADAGCRLPVAKTALRHSESPACSHAVVPTWLEPARGFDRPPGIAAFYGKVAPSIG